MNPQAPELLAQLRDIHAAPAAPWWPPAPGWWVLAALTCLVLFLAGRWAWRGLRVRRRRRRLAGYVDVIESGIDPAGAPQAFVSAINRVFKAAAIAAFPDESCAGMQGADWVRFLQSKSDGDPQAAHLEVLADGPYRPDAPFEPEVLTGLARRWIARHG